MPGGSNSTTGPYNPGTNEGNTGPYNPYPSGGFGLPWTGGILNGAFNATPSSGEPASAPSVDDATSNTDGQGPDSDPSDEAPCSAETYCTVVTFSDNDSDSDSDSDAPGWLAFVGVVVDFLGETRLAPVVAVGDGLLDIDGAFNAGPPPPGSDLHGYAFIEAASIASAVVASAQFVLVVKGMSFAAAALAVAKAAPAAVLLAKASTLLGVVMTAGYVGYKLRTAADTHVPRVINSVERSVYEVERNFWNLSTRGLRR